MFGPFYADFLQGSALRTWNCVSHFANLLWYKFIHLRDPIMPRSRRRHHSRSRSKSRTHSHDRDREPKRRKIENYDSPHHRRSVSSEPEVIEIGETNTENEAAATPPTSPDTPCEEDDQKSKHSPAETIGEETKVKKQSSTSSSDETSLETSIPQSTKDSSEEMEADDATEDDDLKDKNESVNPESDVDNDPLDESVKNNTPNKMKEKTEDLGITPKNVLSPKQLQRKLEFERKRQEREKEREEGKRKRLEKECQRMEEKKKLIEEKMRLKQEKEEQKMKEKQARQEEKDKRRREKEEKEELKKKEREQEKLKKQQELDEKNKEKQKLVEKKQKTAAAFANFFVTKKSDPAEDRKSEDSSKFMPFEVKSDMRLAPLLRRSFEVQDKIDLDEKLNCGGDSKSYLEELKVKDIGKWGKTWTSEEADPEDDVVVIEENVGESIVEQKAKLEKMRAKFFKFHENQRPPYFGTWKKRSKTVSATKPFEKDPVFNYEVDSDEEWEEEGEGESLKGTDDEDEKENESDNEYEVDNDVFVPHAYLSDDEINDEEDVRLSPSAHKAKLKLLKNEFDEEMKSKTQKIKPRVIGCVWYNRDKSNVEDAIDRYLAPFSVICNGQIQIKKRSDLLPSHLRKVAKQLGKEHVPVFLKLIHGSVDKRKNIVKDFIEYMSNNGVQLEVSQLSLGKQLKTFAQWQKCPEEGPMHNKMCWYVGEDVRKEYNVNLAVPNQVVKARQRKAK